MAIPFPSLYIAIKPEVHILYIDIYRYIDRYICLFVILLEISQNSRTSTFKFGSHYIGLSVPKTKRPSVGMRRETTAMPTIFKGKPILIMSGMSM